jgi:hypothetical protein
LRCAWSNRKGDAMLDPEVRADCEMRDLTGLLPLLANRAHVNERARHPGEVVDVGRGRLRTSPAAPPRSPPPMPASACCCWRRCRCRAGSRSARAAGWRVATDEAKALEYLRATDAGSTPDELLQAFAREATGLRDRFEALARINGAKVAALDRPANYDLPRLGCVPVHRGGKRAGFDARREYPHARSLKAGINAFKVVDDNVRARPAIEVRLSSPCAPGAGRARARIAGVQLRRRRAGSRHRAPRRDPRLRRFESAMRCSASTGRCIRCFRPPRAATPATASAWRRRVAPTCSTCGTSTAATASATPIPTYVFGIRSKKLPDWTPG